MADLRIVLQLPNEDQQMDVDDEDVEGGDDDSGHDQQGQRSYNTIGSGIMAFYDSSMPSPLDITTPEELLTPLARLRSFAVSDNIFNRRMIAHDACNVLESVQNDDADFEAAVQCYIKLSEDLEPSVRVELMEQILEITERFNTRVLDSAVVPILLRYLTDVNNQVRKTCHCVLVDITRRGYMEVERFEKEIMPLLQDLTSRKQAPDEYRTEAIALICQICEAFGSEFVREHFLPIFLESCHDETIFHVRKVCAANFSSFCDIFDGSLINEALLPSFIELCKDNVWGVRKSCAESFPDFAKHTSEQIRIEMLSPIFSGLLSDQSRWVRVAAFESLGPFISTFADSKNAKDNLNQAAANNYQEKSGYNENQVTELGDDFDSFLFWRDPIPQVSFDEDFDDLTVFENDEIQSQIYTNSGTSTHHNEEDKESVEITVSASEMTVIIPTAEVDLTNGVEDGEYSPTKQPVFKTVEFSSEKENLPDSDIKLEDQEEQSAGDATTSEKFEPKMSEYVLEGPSSEYDNLNVVPSITLTAPEEANDEILPASLEKPENDEVEDSVPADGDFPNVENSEIGEERRRPSQEGGGDFDENEPRNWETPNLHDYTEFFDADSNERCEIDYRFFSSDLSDISYARRDRIHDPFESGLTQSTSNYSIQQNVIPQQLLDNFLSMTDPSRKQTVDTEIAKHCAYSLPGVAYTLGRNNWHCLKDVYQNLATDVQWKVRRTVASSIHELAKILGEELTATELVPIFNGFLKDLDDVRIGVLRHLADFLKLLNPKVRGAYLYQLTDFLTIDNSRNWRFRYELAKQLSYLVDLYDADDIVKYVCPIAMRLATDRVVAVQNETGRLISTLLSKLQDDNSDGNHFEIFVTRINTEIAKSTKWKERSLFSKMCLLILTEISLPFGTFLQYFSPPLVELASDGIVNVRISTAKALSYAANTFCDEGEGEDISAALKELKNDKDRDVRFYASA